MTNNLTNNKMYNTRLIFNVLHLDNRGVKERDRPKENWTSSF